MKATAGARRTFTATYALGIGHDPGQHAAYVKSWVRILKDDQTDGA